MKPKTLFEKIWNAHVVVERENEPSLIYIDRCNQFKENPPPEDWDGVFTLTSK